MEEARQYTAVRWAATFMAFTMLAGCSPKQGLSCDMFSPVEGITSAEEMLVFPNEIVGIAADLRLQIAADPGLAGLSGSSMARVGGTKSYAFASELNHLRRLVAYQVALEQANANGGTPLVSLSDEKSCELLADSVASLDQVQSAAQLEDHLGQVTDHFGPDYPYRKEAQTI